MKGNSIVGDSLQDAGHGHHYNNSMISSKICRITSGVLICVAWLDESFFSFLALRP
jgi:hypothetical protein